MVSYSSRGLIATIEPSPGYSVLYRIPEGDTIKTTIYYQEMPYD